MYYVLSTVRCFTYIISLDPHNPSSTHSHVLYMGKKRESMEIKFLSFLLLLFAGTKSIRVTFSKLLNPLLNWSLISFIKDCARYCGVQT